MLCFPQLSTGTLAQLPLRRTIRRPAIVNALLDGKTIKAPDPDAHTIEWQLAFTGITDNERATLEAFFVEAQGRLRTFLFLDPAGNLLRWSEDLGNTVWRRDGLLQLAGAIGDPEGGQSASRITNASQTTQGIEQTIEAPGDLHYVFSIWARSGSGAALSLMLASPHGSISNSTRLGSSWRRVYCTGSVGGAAEEISVRLDVPAGGVVEVFGPQLEAQPMPSEYRRTTGTCGLFPATRFADDRLACVANGIDDHAVRMTLISRAGA